MNNVLDKHGNPEDCKPVAKKLNFLIKQSGHRNYIRFLVYIEIEIQQQLPYGLVVRIPAFHAGGPGSIPVWEGEHIFVKLLKHFLFLF